MRTGCLILICCALLSCNKSIDRVNFSEASYEVTISGQWKSPEFTVPAAVHFTSFAGMVHNENVILWMKDQPASPGVELVAEDGNPGVLFSEVNAGIANKTAIAPVNIPPPSATGSITRNIYVNTNYSRVSLISMIAPSPDWFVGISAVGLYRNENWVADTVINLFVHDAGTEEGDVFGYNNPESIPRQPIQLLTPAKATVLANGNAVLAPIATIRFRKLN